VLGTESITSFDGHRFNVPEKLNTGKICCNIPDSMSSLLADFTTTDLASARCTVFGRWMSGEEFNFCKVRLVTSEGGFW
jgi:hypothetical protein